MIPCLKYLIPGIVGLFFLLFLPTMAVGQNVPVTSGDESEMEPAAEAVNEPAAETATEKLVDVPIKSTPITTTAVSPLPKNEPEEKKKTFTVDAKIHAGWTLEHEPDASGDAYENTFYIRKARLKLSWEPEDWILGVIQVDAADAFDSTSPMLKDAYIHLVPDAFLQIRLGQFKKPYSALKLRSAAKNRTIGRGLGNGLIVEDLRYGDRDIGVMISGRIVPAVKFDYAVGAFNGSGPAIDDFGNAKDIVGRLKISPTPSLTIGANGSLKFIDDAATELGQPSTGWAAGGDVKFRTHGFRAFAQALWAVDHQLYSQLVLDADDPPTVLNALGVVSYKHKFKTSFRFALEPVFKFELLDPQMKVMDDTIFIYTPGINAHMGKYIRLMFNGEIIRMSRNTLDVTYSDSEKIMVLLCLDI